MTSPEAKKIPPPNITSSQIRFSTINSSLRQKFYSPHLAVGGMPCIPKFESEDSGSEVTDNNSMIQVFLNFSLMKVFENPTVD